MILVDASVWIDHIRASDSALSKLLSRREVFTHPFVIGEIALGHLRPRDLVLSELQKLRSTEIASAAEVLRFVDRYHLFGRGVGYVDVHLLAATMLTDDCALWTRDKRLHGIAQELGIAAEGLD
jgi:hypothetical protein